MGVASDSGAVIRVEMMNGAEQEFYFDPDPDGPSETPAP